MRTEDARVRRKTVLLAEDNASIRRLVSLALARAGLCVLGAVDGTDAVSLLGERAGAIDLLIADVFMPGLDGRDLARLFKIRNPRAAILLTSGAPLQGNPGHHFLAKPFRVDRLLEVVRGLLAGS